VKSIADVNTDILSLKLHAVN